MPYAHLPRFKRSIEAAPLHLTERDRQIICLVHRHRFLRSPQILALLGDSSQQVLRRLQLLYHHGFLERPRAQLDYYHLPGSRHIVYGLGNKGAALLKRELGGPLNHIRWGEKNRSVGRIFLEHALLVSDVMVALELASRESGQVRLLTEEEIALPPDVRQLPQPFHWRVKVAGGLELGIIPDRAFALEYTDRHSRRERAYFFLEADRGTMPVIRRNLSQTSFYRKLLAYAATWSQSLHWSRFGFHRFRVLTITESAERVESLVNACSKLERGHGLFLFADRAILDKPGLLFSRAWRSGRHGEITSSLDSQASISCRERQISVPGGAEPQR